MTVAQSKNYRIVTVSAYSGVFPITAYMVQRRQERTFLPDKWINIKGYENRKEAEQLYKALL